MALSQHQPVASGMLDQPASGLHHLRLLPPNPIRPLAPDPDLGGLGGVSDSAMRAFDPYNGSDLLYAVRGGNLATDPYTW